MSDNETITSFAFTLGFKVGGLIDSDMSHDETRERLEKEIVTMYGQGVTLLDFHEATQEELDLYTQFLGSEDDDSPLTVN